MASLALPQVPPVRRLWALLAGAFLLALGAVLVAQVGGDRGIIPVASSEDIEVRGIKVDVTGKDPQDARLKGWAEARKLAWEKLDGPDIPDSQANFVWLPIGAHAVDFAVGCEKRGVIVRPFAGDGVRVTIGTPAENDRFLAAARELLPT